MTNVSNPTDPGADQKRRSPTPSTHDQASPRRIAVSSITCGVLVAALIAALHTLITQQPAPLAMLATIAALWSGTCAALLWLIATSGDHMLEQTRSLITPTTAINRPGRGDHRR